MVDIVRSLEVACRKFQNEIKQLEKLISLYKTAFSTHYSHSSFNQDCHECKRIEKLEIEIAAQNTVIEETK